MYLHMRVKVHILRLGIYIYTYIDIFVVHVCVRMHVYVCVQTLICKHTYFHTHIYTYIHLSTQHILSFYLYINHNRKTV